MGTNIWFIIYFQLYLIEFLQATRSDFAWHLQKKELIFDPVEHVRNIFSRSDWQVHAELLNELPLLFVSAFFGLKADQPSTIEFQLIDSYGVAPPCFSDFRTTTSSVFKIIKATYPTLRNKILQ